MGSHRRCADQSLVKGSIKDEGRPLDRMVYRVWTSRCAGVSEKVCGRSINLCQLSYFRDLFSLTGSRFGWIGEGFGSSEMVGA